MTRREFVNSLTGIVAGSIAVVVGSDFLRESLTPVVATPGAADHHPLLTPLGFDDHTQYLLANPTKMVDESNMKETFEQLQQRLKNLKHVHAAMGLRSKSSLG